eukprot:CAMPEP_0176348308 /NCGR_PEP_ID=MMETSP0126-20121128/7757_1 /TAXON_ID=141414 ORGANISM="Strombidinopsis acuminatum, Strain SPMC142" /NCGR_SAMPLE_ID=MMETSP0126 /ASSEMBLY_ACC=CAM_ASM_000229 /LENGTH=39 /DNA_ID= /DNA_START= /DNA_END= /DNA_ORIENTATION=
MSPIGSLEEDEHIISDDKLNNGQDFYELDEKQEDENLLA